MTYNPYAGVDWNTTFRLKTQLHAHTNLGGGGSPPQDVINNYAAAGFNALGISDYNQLTWPWTTWEEYLTPVAKNMVAIPNDEVALSTVHFTAPFLTAGMDGKHYKTDVQSAIDDAIAVGGIPIIAHPVVMGFDITTCDTWTGFQGIEIYNPTELGIQPFDFQLWDHLLTDPGRADKHIWGFAVDDSHDTTDINQGWIIVYAAQKTATGVEDSIISGSFVAVINSTNSINNITQVGNTLTVDATSSVVWKADGEQIVGTGSTLDLDTLAPGYTYVRAEVGDREIFTQPIFIMQTSPHIIFENGFEDGFASWTNLVVQTGTVAQSSDTAHSGLCSAEISGIQYGGDKAYANKSLATALKRVNIRAYVNFSSDSTTGIMMGPLSLSSPDYYAAVVTRNFALNRWGIMTFNPLTGAETYHWESGMSAITINKWYYIELEAVMSVNGFATLWIDGAMELNVTNVDFYTSTVTSVGVGECDIPDNLSTFLKFYIDDVAVSDGYIGPITQKYTLSVDVTGHGSTNTTGISMYDEFTYVTVLATPDSGYYFDYWLLNDTNVGSANPYTINMTANYRLTAVFNPPSTYLVIRGTDNSIYYRGYNPTSNSWENWSAIPYGSTLDGPASTLVGDQLFVVVRGVNYDQIWFSYINLTDSSFSGWTLLNGATPSAPTLTSNGTALCLVVRGETNSIWYRFCDIASRVWGEWFSLPDGATRDTPAAALLEGTLQVTVRGVNYDQIWHCYVNLSDNTFEGWTLLNGATPSAPTLITNGTTLCLVVRGETDIIWYRRYNINTQVWNDWTAIYEGATMDRPAATFTKSELQLVVRGLNGDQIWHGNVSLADSAFSGWTLLSGSTPSAPTLTD